MPDDQKAHAHEHDLLPFAECCICGLSKTDVQIKKLKWALRRVLDVADLNDAESLPDWELENIVQIAVDLAGWVDMSDDQKTQHEHVWGADRYGGNEISCAMKDCPHGDLNVPIPLVMNMLEDWFMGGTIQPIEDMEFIEWLYAEVSAYHRE